MDNRPWDYRLRTVSWSGDSIPIAGAALPPSSESANPKKKLSGRGSFSVGIAIQGREHSVLWSRTGDRTKCSKSGAEADARLLARLKLRDEHAFLSLYDRHVGSVFRFLMHMTGSVASAEELTQEVFVAVLDSMCRGTIGRFDPEKGTFEGYLLGIARNLMRVERRRTRRLLSLDSDVETPAWKQALDRFFQETKLQDAETRLAVHSELRVLYNAILELPNHYRETIVLCGLQEKSYQEAAAILQCSEGTIASRMNRAKALLAGKLRRPASSEVNASTT